MGNALNSKSLSLKLSKVNHIEKSNWVPEPVEGHLAKTSFPPPTSRSEEGGEMRGHFPPLRQAQGPAIIE